VNRSRIASFVLCSAMLVLSSHLALAQAPGPQCSFTASNISFGTVDLKKGNPYDAAGTLAYACTGDAKEILRICASWGLANDGTRWMTGPGGAKLIYNLYTDEARHTVWGTWYSKNLKGALLEVPLGRSEKITGSIPIYGRIAANQQNVPPGAYQAKIEKGDAAISYGYASKGSCELLKSGDRLHVGVRIAANVGGEGGPAPITAPDATKPQAAAAAPVTTGQPEGKKSIWEKLAENAQYQQQKQKDEAAQRQPRDADNDSASQDAAGKGDRAKYIETHSCMTTGGADKANALAEDCNKVTSAPHDGCNIQENTCDEIRKTTQKGCWRMAASAPDFCLTRYR
jgi:spore coat protein U-like protein